MSIDLTVMKVFQGCMSQFTKSKGKDDLTRTKIIVSVVAEGLYTLAKAGGLPREELKKLIEEAGTKVAP